MTRQILIFSNEINLLQNFEGEVNVARVFTNEILRKASAYFAQAELDRRFKFFYALSCY
jgi:hypothetical protein